MPTTKSKKATAKVLIVDDHPAVREALALRISKTRDIEVCGEAADMCQAIKLVDELKPDIAIIDISLKTSDGIELIKRLKGRHPTLRMLVWSMHSETLYAERALRAGAMGYITKEQATGQIVEAIQQVREGKLYLSPAMTERLLHRAVGEGVEKVYHATVNSLSDRELEVFRHIGNGQKTAEIAQLLHLSIKTVETYRDRIRQKLNLNDGLELTRYATQWIMSNQ